MKTTTKEWLIEQMKISKIPVREYQVKIMAKIWDYLVENEKFDYTGHDLRRMLKIKLSYYTQVQMALFRLQQLGLIKEIRTIEKQTSYQVSTW